jgi:hypothetical protein
VRTVRFGPISAPLSGAEPAAAGRAVGRAALAVRVRCVVFFRDDAALARVD